jgi:hypothetical protein
MIIITQQPTQAHGSNTFVNYKTATCFSSKVPSSGGRSMQRNVLLITRSTVRTAYGKIWSISSTVSSPHSPRFRRVRLVAKSAYYAITVHCFDSIGLKRRTHFQKYESFEGMLLDHHVYLTKRYQLKMLNSDVYEQWIEQNVELTSKNFGDISTFT